MDWPLWLVMGLLAALCWWAGFVATKRMRLEKNREREERARRLRSRRSAASSEGEEG
ncbi:MAG: hypothetical protein R8K47_01310 [Mariprofundaceae bacterium]